MLSTTTFLALAMQCAASVHPDTTHEVARVESGFNPYAIAEIIPKVKRKPGDKGVVSYFPKTKEAALQIVNQIESRNHRYSVGLMQITSTNFATFNTTAEKMFDPCENLKVSEKILVDCYKRGGDLLRGLSCYYSGNPESGIKPEPEFNNTSYVQRIGLNPQNNKKSFVVPSVKEIIKKENNTPTITPEEIIIYPQYAIRGTVSNEKETKDVEIKSE
ncbi:lytic transglycosylase domain-containing protein [Salmonella enterica subsp. enterica serovar Oranienburg]|nr:lytic transglycosylase domain-containing protein [Salmonella enterica subsp. enterica serovar Oranienburg]EDW7094724.1 lytic transglycosylase domain-containing protein [Salmonella enterica subsp. enterica serovar Urbana]EIR4567765.1 lytic transglycosylase domain-containing protein [Salmonella enterica]EEJ1918283.1 lytic transglycosylase domain-containing protein [Salmonella enterica subsp. enterica serovar Urbana]EIU7679882.1 lytic transglycosylase domain-containing protein [Salmonella enter